MITCDQNIYFSFYANVELHVPMSDARISNQLSRLLHDSTVQCTHGAH